MKFTLSKLFIVVAMLALACAGMMYRNRWWTDCIEAISFTLFAYVGIWAISRRGRGQASAFAFAIIGVGYLVITMVMPEQGASLPTNYPLAALGTLLPELETSDDPFGQISPATFTQLLDWRARYNSHSVVCLFTIGHCVFSWLFATLAAWFAGRMYDRRIKSPGPI